MILDTNVLIDLEKGHPNAHAWLKTLSAPPSVCGFSAMEFKQGAHGFMGLRQAEQFLSPFEIVWATESDLDRALTEYARYPHTHGVGLLDLLIATTAVGRGEELVTFNLKHFQVIPGLVTTQPYQR